MFRLFFALSLSALSLTRAQSIGSALSGTVLDSQSLPVEKARVTVRNLGDGSSANATTISTGAFQFPSLAPGDYAVTIEKEGFATAAVDLVRLTVGESRTLRATLQPAGVAQQVTVNDSISDVRLTSGEAGASLGERPLDLPMISGGTGRNFRTQVYLTPGVTPSTTAHRPFAVSGARSRNNNYLLDSNDYNEIEGGLLMGRGSSEQLISPEALEGIQVLTHNFKAEYGRQNGSIVSMVTKRGTNAWHGLGYEYLRNDKLDARNTFDTVRPPVRFNQFGFNLGGPIRKNKTFVFGNGEAFLRRQTSASTIQTLTPAQRAQAVDAVKPLVAMYPEPNIPGTNLHRAIVPTGGEQWTFVARLDHEINDWMRVFLRSTALNSVNNGAGNAALQRFQTKPISQGHSIHHIWSPDSRTVNEARFNYTRYTLYDVFLDPVQLGDPRVNGEVGSVTVNGLTQLGHQVFLRRSTAQNNFQWTDDLSRVLGRHSLKAGVAIRRLQLNSGTITTGFTGQLRFNNVADFLAGRAASYNRNIGNPYIGQRATESNAYFQDDWQIASRLVLNLGLRYEYNSVPTEVNGLIADRYTFLPDRNNFAPRFGFAYRADRDGKTAIRGGYGIYYNVLELSFVGLTRFNPPLIQNFAAASPTFPNLLGNAQAGIPSGLVVPQRDARQPYSQHLNLTVERQVWTGSSLSAAYVGTLGRKAPRTARPNGGDALTQSLRPDPTTGVLNRLETAAASTYHALQTTFQHTGRRGLYLRASYTWSKFIDEVSDFPSGNQNIDRGLLALDERDWRLNRGPSDFDMRHVATLAFSYELPWLKRNRWIGGWTVQGIWTAQSGRPYTLYSGTDNLFGTNNNRILDLPGTLLRNPSGDRRAIDVAPGATKAQLTPVRGTLGTIGRNTERGDRLFSFNVGVNKRVAISDRWSVELRGEAFNAFNQTNYASPDGVLSSGNFGQAVSAFDPRQIQLAIRLNF